MPRPHLDYHQKQLALMFLLQLQVFANTSLGQDGPSVVLDSRLESQNLSHVLSPSPSPSPSLS